MMFTEFRWPWCRSFFACACLGSLLWGGMGCSGEKDKSGGGLVDGGMDDAGLPPPTHATPVRLHIVGDHFEDAQGSEVRLRGANFQGVSAEEAKDFADTLHLNLARLRITFGKESRDPQHPSGLSAAYRASIDAWVSALAAERVWILLEMRGDDEITNDASLYELDGENYAAWEKAWLYLADRFRSQDYILGYGLLAEPSANKAVKHGDPLQALLRFQRSLMEAITHKAGDSTTPFFIGGDWNYDSMQLRHDGYFTHFAGYEKRLAYEVNFLVPKIWIKDGSVPSGVNAQQSKYPQPDAADYAPLIAPADPSLVVPQDLERIFSDNEKNPSLFPSMLSRGFIAWYLSWAMDFRTRHRVPMVIDQFGASVDSQGQLAYELDLIEFCEANGLGWARWGYNAGSQSRFIVGNDDVHGFYENLGQRWPAP